ncbi:MAG: ribosomal protein large subunit ribosomal protein [Candidatus Taylorbacteria bacterium]|nr:ribosomal protein large subunit ribosomal protein [Candidatus Taylorbacteria bacterium]
MTIDATGKRLGRVASEAASHLLGKKSPTFARNEVADVKVRIVNCAQAYIDTKKKADKEYVTFTGFRGGLNTESLSALIARKGICEPFQRAVYRMIPGNSLRKKRMMNLTISE